MTLRQFLICWFSVGAFSWLIIGIGLLREGRGVTLGGIATLLPCMFFGYFSLAGAFLSLSDWPIWHRRII